MRRYEFKLANDERWYLISGKTLEEIKQEILNNKWIKLYSSGWKSINNGYTYIPKESDIQTCNIVYVYEEKDYQKTIDEQKRTKEESLKIIKEIESYKFNLRMRWWYFWNIKFLAYLDEDLEHPLLTFNKGYLNLILNVCKKYKCKRKEE